jgi:uncharacterized protein YjbI with pentapeptide repeats
MRTYSKKGEGSMLASQDHIDILKSGVGNWNKWREENKSTKPALEFVYLEKAHLEKANLVDAYLQGAELWGADLGGADLRGANLRGANLAGAHLGGANLEGAHLEGANLGGARLEGADLSKVKSFYKAKLDPHILSEIKAKWPEKLATLLDVRLMDWVIDVALLEQVKKPDWNGWPDDEDQGK